MPATAPPLASLTVLIVDDVKLFRTGLRALLEEAGVKRIVEAMDGQSAVILYDRHKPDIVLMDIGLPGMNGIEATQKIREQYPDARIVMLTSHDGEDDVVQSFASGANAYCLKDIDEGILQIMQTVMSGSVWIDRTVAGYMLEQFRDATPRANQEEPLDAPLNERDIAILKMIAEGKNNPEIATEMNVSVHTVRVYVGQIFEKLGVQDRTKAAVKSMRLGLIE